MPITLKLTCIIFDSLFCENGSQLIFKSQQNISCVHNSGSIFDGKIGTTIGSGIDVGQGITVGPGKFVKKNKRRALNKRRA